MVKRTFLLFWILFFSGCAINHQEKAREILQTHGATSLRYDYKKIVENLIIYKEKLDMRNPKNFDKNMQSKIYNDMRNFHNSLQIDYNGVTLKTYDDYLKVAFDKEHTVPDRNDFLILGLYKLIWESYKIADGHQVTTLTYNEEAFKKLYYYLEVVKWKIKTDKDKNGNFLFLTWQNNWQSELNAKLNLGQKLSVPLIENLPSIKSQKENLLSPSNFNFEVILSQIIFHVKNSARIIGKEPVDVGIDTMIGLVLFL